MTINEEVPHLVTSRREVLLALEETEIEAIVYALEVYFLENRPVDPTKNSENDSVAGRFDSLKDKVIARNDNLPGIERSFCIGCITRHVIKPLKELKKEDMSEETRIKLDERINFYWNLVLKLKFGKK
jgi:hypothetical protein